ncbi:hypothetical protein K2E96_16235 [Pseudomonas sp. ERGC3:05]|nr:hypothetical protein K2E96_16235 [Pseudomonas sp. ERGC3:05]
MRQTFNTTKQLRILVFDHQFFNCLYIERIFNQLGYSRVMPISRYEGFVRVIESATVPIGMVLYNVQDCEKHDGGVSFIHNSPYVENFMPYNENDGYVVTGKDRHSSGLGYSRLPDFFTIRNKMETIEANRLNS